MVDYVLIKGDISGIQEFIFNIKSKGAARALKARSYRIEILGWLAEEKVKEVFVDAETIYNGGGNFYTKIPASSWDIIKFKKLQSDIIEELPKSGTLSITLTETPYDSNQPKTYGKTIKKLNELSNGSKMAGYSQAIDPIRFFKPFPHEKKDDQSLFVDFTDKLARRKYRDIRPVDSEASPISQLFGYQVKLHEMDPKTKSIEPIYRHIPLWKDNEIIKHKKFTEDMAKADPEFHPPKKDGIVEFEYLSHFAHLRSGTDKLGILKLDIDNLGALFTKVGDEKENKILSEDLVNFFAEELDKLLNEKFYYKIREKTIDGKEKPPKKVDISDWTEKKGKTTIEYYEYEKDAHAIFRDNLYVVFAGGDDSFIIGAWDAIIEFALKLQERFAGFEAKIRKDKLKSLDKPITLSAAVVVVDAHYPVIKFAELADSELYRAKKHSNESNLLDASDKPMKNNIAFLGQVFSWEDFKKDVVQVKEKMVEMIVKYNAPKAFVQRIIASFENSETDRWQIQEQKKPFSPALLWRFLYHFRDIRNLPYFKHFFYKDYFGDPNEQKLGGYYRKYIWNYFESNKGASQVLPIAARWTEFLTREKQTENG